MSTTATLLGILPLNALTSQRTQWGVCPISQMSPGSVDLSDLPRGTWTMSGRRAETPTPSSPWGTVLPVPKGGGCASAEKSWIQLGLGIFRNDLLASLTCIITTHAPGLAPYLPFLGSLLAPSSPSLTPDRVLWGPLLHPGSAGNLCFALW